MPRTEAQVCPTCDYPNAADELVCGMCGALLQRAPAGTAPGSADVGARNEPACLAPQARAAEPRLLGMPLPLFYLLVGVPSALLFASGPFMRSYAWFLGALFHEFGHTVAGLAFGLPSFPAISLRGHAVTVHQEQVTGMVWAAWVALAALAWHQRANRARCAPLIVAAVLYPLIAFTGVREVLFLTGGHLGELAFAWLCLSRALTGGFTHGAAERGCYSALGWLLVGSNVGLCFGLATSPAARDHYAGNGSFGLTNDYIRLADDVLGTSLQAVAAAMLLVSLLPVPLALLAFRVRRSELRAA